jgi:hypothetical protein
MTEEVHVLEPVKSLWKVWSHEAHRFTPWLAKRLDRLGDALSMELELEATEVTLPLAGRADIVARQAPTGAKVVVENQLGESDDSHCLRLLGYAADAEASVVVWVAQSFHPYHQRILNWLNEADTIDVYAVTVRAYRVGEALAVDFQTVVQPPQSRPGSSPPATVTTGTLYAEFYRPLVARLQRSGMPKVGKGGWRGRWRSFQTGHAGAVYGTELEEEKAQVFLQFHGEGHQHRYRALLQHRDEIAGRVEGTVLWEEGSEGASESLVRLEREEGTKLTGPEEDLEAVRRWMADNLLALRDAVQPHLDQVMGTRNDRQAGALEAPTGGG